MRKYDTYGLPLAVQIWAYETVPHLGTRFARRGETQCPRMDHWRASRADGCPSGKQLSALIDDPQLEVLMELTPSMEEESRGLVRELVVPHTPRDQMSDSIEDQDRERGPVDQRSPPPSTESPPLPMRSHSSPSRHVPRGSPAHSDLYVLLAGFMAEMREEIGVLRGEAKRKTFVDGMYSKLFREVDHVKRKVFETEWRRIMLRDSSTVGGGRSRRPISGFTNHHSGDLARHDHST
ncbi:unnamed protein product [Fraxinus pennsylvanica]|uniref:Uncharacterized protein n=1 Tax=Fraxinus pennsylvanica TaxID=56036 RepID=A0AAD1ZEC6_9LAMI|nr:unnamed protein product [Fraxinus pennsylvanica]